VWSAETLTDCEAAILRCLADGLSSKEIATTIGRSKSTVEFYVRALCLKLEARSRVHLVAQAIRLGIV
jgi:DNA-binding NarL/FixJ family response regulator